MTISAKIIADSISPQGVRLTTFELEYPRFIHAEMMTHRVFSRNAQSSRAVPVSKSLALEYVEPIIYGKNQPGMSSYEELSEEARKECQYYWHALVRYCKDFSERMSKAGLHKQWANRPLEWHSNIKVVVTATEWDNFFWLRIDPAAAQPEIVELAGKMHDAMMESKPQRLYLGMWHLPYVQTLLFQNGDVQYRVGDTENWISLDVETAKKISASCCASVSYRKLDTSIEKALSIYTKLFSGPKPHLSPVEHLATPMAFPLGGYDEGATHVNIEDGSVWSNNLRGWVQYRKLLEKEFGHNTLR